MNGPDHYREAERLLEAAKDDVRSLDEDADPVRYARILDRASIAISVAGVHARLASVAATATHGQPPSRGWLAVFGIDSYTPTLAGNGSANSPKEHSNGA